MLLAGIYLGIRTFYLSPLSGYATFGICFASIRYFVAYKMIVEINYDHQEQLETGMRFCHGSANFMTETLIQVFDVDPEIE